MRAAVLGSPIAHSLSPVLHTAAYRALGLDDWIYEAIECDEAGLPALLDSLGPEWAGLSLTMPLKRAVLPLLDDADPLVTEVGTANTVVLAEGRRSGYNTDIPGMVSALAEAGVALPGGVGSEWPGGSGGGSELTGDVLVLGGGATATSALAALRDAGARGVTMAVRDQARGRHLLEAADRIGIGVRLAPFGPDEPRRAWLAGPGARLWPLLLSTVPAGAADGWADLIAEGQIAVRVVFDVVYHPWPTRLATAAAGVGAGVIGGFELLLHQAAEQVRLMTGRSAPVEAMREAGLAQVAPRSDLRRQAAR
jgi:shikimate dehydrogenase